MHSSNLFPIVLLPSSILSHTYKFDPLKHLAGVTTPFDPFDPPLDPSSPHSCNVTRAALLDRHAAIYANDFDYESYIKPFVQKLSNTTQKWINIPMLSFLSTWQNPITDADQEMLTRSGKFEATKLGVDVSQRYQNLRTARRIWTSTAERTVKSAKSFANGLADDSDSIQIQQVYEGEKDGANSLTLLRVLSSIQWLSRLKSSYNISQYICSPIIARFNSLAPAFNFTPSDIYAMSLLCGYENVIRGSSPFCSLSLLSPNDWLGFEYANDVMYHYNLGYGQPTSGAIGFPWVNATFNTLMSTQKTANNATQDEDLLHLVHSLRITSHSPCNSGITQQLRIFWS